MIIGFELLYIAIDHQNHMKNKRKTTTEIICENLELPYQTIFQDYKCTLKSSLSYFGRLYIGEEHLMFVSNMFGIVKKMAIVIDNISKISQSSNETIVINGKVNRSNVQEELIFTGFKNNSAFKIIKALWKKEKLSYQILSTNNEEDIDPTINQVKSIDDANI